MEHITPPHMSRGGRGGIGSLGEWDSESADFGWDLQVGEGARGVANGRRGVGAAGGGGVGGGAAERPGIMKNARSAGSIHMSALGRGEEEAGASASFTAIGRWKSGQGMGGSWVVGGGAQQGGYVPGRR